MMQPHRCTTGGLLLGGQSARGETLVGEARVRSAEVQEGAGLVLTRPLSGVKEVSSGASVINTCFLSFILVAICRCQTHKARMSGYNVTQ